MLNVLVTIVATVVATAAICPAQFMRGVDLSLVQKIQDAGVQYHDAGRAEDPLVIFKQHGCNWVRLRLFVDPNGTEGRVNTLKYTLNLARRVKAARLRFLLDLHYSDDWADPSHQLAPAAWKGFDHPAMVKRIYQYTADTLAAFRSEQCAPDMVEIGNEITNGMVWPDAGPLIANAKWANLADDLKAGIDAVDQTDPQHAIKIMIHIDKGGSKDVCRWFFDNLQQRNVRFDVIGLSYYPFWHGTLADLKDNLAFLSGRYKKDIVVVETGYDTGGGPQGALPYPLTPQGQRDYLEALIRIVAATPGNHGQGVCYWAPEWIQGSRWNGPAWSGQWESRALFDNTGNARPAIHAFAVPLR